MSDNSTAMIESKIDRESTGEIILSSSKGALTFEKMGEVMDFAKLMAISREAIPVYLRNNVGACLAVAIQANEWQFSPYAVARFSYVVNDQIAYMSQLIHAVIESRAPLKQRLRPTYEGHGLERVCVIVGHIVGEVDPLEYRSPAIKDIKPQNSPLWKVDPDQQLFYYSSRAWARRYCPDVLLGAYSDDELRDSHVGAANAVDITPSAPANEELHHRLSLKAVKGAGFDAAAVAKMIEATGENESAQAEGGAAPADQVQREPERAPPVEQQESAAASGRSPSGPAVDGAGAAIGPQPSADPAPIAKVGAVADKNEGGMQTGVVEQAPAPAAAKAPAATKTPPAAEASQRAPDAQGRAFTESEFDEAREKGAKAYRQGRSKKSSPLDYRDAGWEPMLAQFIAGYDAALQTASEV
jgi:hypothetical protein